MQTEETGETRVRTDCLNFDVSLWIQIKKQISIRGSKHWDYIFCGIVDPAAVQDCTKFPSLITDVAPQLVKDIINEVCYQRYEKPLEQQKGRLEVSFCAAKENLEEELQGVYKVWVNGKKHKFWDYPSRPLSSTNWIRFSLNRAIIIKIRGGEPAARVNIWYGPHQNSRYPI